MDKGFLAGITQATALTRAGRLAEATALIQRTLAGGSTGVPPFSATSVRTGTATDGVIEGQCSEVLEATANVKSERSVGPGRDVRRRRGPEDASGTWRRGPLDDEPRAAAEAAATRRGEWIAGLYANSTGERAYKLYVPSSYTGEPLPLIVMLHGCNQTPDDFAAGTRMNALAEDQSCFVLYPAQSNTAN